MNFLLFALGYTLVVLVLKIALQIRWTRQLHARYSGAYSYKDIFRKSGALTITDLSFSHGKLWTLRFAAICNEFKTEVLHGILLSAPS